MLACKGAEKSHPKEGSNVHLKRLGRTFDRQLLLSALTCRDVFVFPYFSIHF
jgi:hypothetical protein